MTCEHEGCGCQVDSSRKDGYCSDQCAVGGAGSAACICGHPGCGE